MNFIIFIVAVAAIMLLAYVCFRNTRGDLEELAADIVRLMRYVFPGRVVPPRTTHGEKRKNDEKPKNSEVDHQALLDEIVEKAISTGLRCLFINNDMLTYLYQSLEFVPQFTARFSAIPIIAPPDCRYAGTLNSRVGLLKVFVRNSRVPVKQPEPIKSDRIAEMRLPPEPKPAANPPGFTIV